MQLNHKESEPREVSAWARETGDEARRDRVVAAGKDDRRRGGGALRRVCCKVAAACGNQVDPTADEFGGQRRQPIVLTLRPAVLDCHVLALDITSLFEALSERGHVCCKGSWRSTAEIANHRQLGLLGSDGERPRRRRAAEERDELASLQLIELHFGPPPARAGLQDTELTRTSQEVMERFCLVCC